MGMKEREREGGGREGGREVEENKSNKTKNNKSIGRGEEESFGKNNNNGYHIETTLRRVYHILMCGSISTNCS